jgi:hypothetical protein
MEVTKKISINKEERKVLSEFFNICNENLYLLEEDMGSLLRAIFTYCRDFEVGDELYDIEYTD